MLILLSPSKKLAKTTDTAQMLPQGGYSEPAFLHRTSELVDICREMSVDDIMELMKVSDAIAKENYQRFESFETPFNLSNAHAAILLFRGNVYDGIEAEKMTGEQLLALNKKIRILSGLYGMVKPLDLIAPYRLEMGRSLANSVGKNLYEFWGTEIAGKLIGDLSKQQEQGGGENIIVDLASKEYSKAAKLPYIKEHISDLQIITPNFKENKNGKYKAIMPYVKKARGTMARWIALGDIRSADELVNFAEDGYVYNADMSTQTEPMFVRG